MQRVLFKIPNRPGWPIRAVPATGAPAPAGPLLGHRLPLGCPRLGSGAGAGPAGCLPARPAHFRARAGAAGGFPCSCAGLPGEERATVGLSGCIALPECALPLSAGVQRKRAHPAAARRTCRAQLRKVQTSEGRASRLHPSSLLPAALSPSLRVSSALAERMPGCVRSSGRFLWRRRGLGFPSQQQMSAGGGSPPARATADFLSQAWGSE